ncbi:MAG: acetate--CoA ligase family protein [Deltaproteobacteria bacterium]|nr:acetate--CoA ligase family protein [Deltaproteobacteria bacterium]
MTTQSERVARKPVEHLLQARSVAIVGASPKGRWPTFIFQNLKKSGYQGKVYLVNPSYQELWEERCYPELAALPEPAEHLLLLIPTKAVLKTLDEAAKLGSRAATIYSAGFGEGEDAEGKERARAMQELCRKTGMVCCGPNCMGTNSVTSGLWCFPTPLPLLRPGPVGLVFQSGGSLGNWMKGALEDLTETILAFLPGRFPKGRRAAIVVNSGGMKGLLLDDIEEVGIELAQLAEATQKAVRPLIPAELAVENPLECGVAGFGDEKGFLEIVRLHAEDPNVDLLGIHGELPRGGEKRDAALFAALTEKTEKPVVAFARATYSLTDESRAFQDSAQVPFLQGIKPTLRALKGLGLYAVRRQKGVASLPAATGKAEDLAGAPFESLLARHGLTLPRQGIASDPAEAAAIAKQIGFPVALKLLAAEVVHKTEAGGVVLGLRGQEEAEAEGKRMLSRSPNGGRLLIQEMVQGTEVILGARTDPQYGPFLMVGLGGVFVEVLKDISIRLLPVGEGEALEMLRELKGYPLLEAYRGQPKRDVNALVRAMTGLSTLFATYRSVLSDLEVNPLIVRPEGAGVAAVDVRMIRRES